jgi:hypothetical protein
MPNKETTAVVCITSNKLPPIAELKINPDGSHEAQGCEASSTASGEPLHAAC